MTDQSAAVASEAAVVSDEALLKAQEFIEEEEGAANRLAGWRAALVTLLAVAVSLYHLYAAYGIVPAQVLRPVHVALVLFLTFLLFPMLKRFRHRIMWWDIVAAGAGDRLRGLHDPGRRRLHGPQHHAGRLGHRLRRGADRAGDGSHAPHHRLDHAGGDRRLRPLRAVRRLPAAAPGPTRATRSPGWSATCT